MTSNAYTQPLDIVNRGLQHLGVPRIASFGDGTQAANEMAFAYDKVRQAELRRNLWRHATRRAVIRPIDRTTMMLQPAAYNPATTYPIGSIVAFPTGTNWVANVVSTGITPSNTGVDANGGLAWDSYYGTLTVPLFAPSLPTTGNSASTLVFTAPGSGGSNVTSQSLRLSGGYQPGELVYIPYGQGLAYIFQCISATGESPLQTDAWDVNKIYQSGQVVSFPGTQVFTLGPSGDLLGSSSSSLGNQIYTSVGNINVGNEPDVTNTGSIWPVWNVSTNYTTVGQVVSDVDNQLYSLLQASHGTGGVSGWQPSRDFGGTYWQPMGMFINSWAPFSGVLPSGASVNQHWQQINVSLVPISLVWPYGAGPAEDITSMNVYHLPSNWLREAPEEPKLGITPWLGGPTYVQQKDWVFEGDYMISRSAGALLMRFVANVNDVTKFDPMFCEALALLLALDTMATIDNDAGQRPDRDYRRVVTEARTVNAIETGPVTPADDQYISVRY